MPFSLKRSLQFEATDQARANALCCMSEHIQTLSMHDYKQVLDQVTYIEQKTSWGVLLACLLHDQPCDRCTQGIVHHASLPTIANNLAHNLC